MTSEVDMLRKELHDHIVYCDAQFAESASTRAQLLAEQKRCNDQLCELVKNTATVIAWTNNMRGAANVASGLQTFGVWLLKWPLIGAGLYAGYKALLKYIGDISS